MRVLISGAGIAGPCLAYWLRRHGFEPTIVERSPVLRTGGYVIDFWGAGFDVADRMGIVPAIMKQGYQVQELRQVSRSGKRVIGLAADILARMTSGRAASISRGDLAKTVYEALEGNVETIYDDSIKSLKDDGREVHVTFERTEARTFDLVIGADGLHSQVRKLCFGEQAQFEKYLGFKVAAVAATGYRPRDELVYIMYTEVGQQISRFSMRDDRTMFLFTWRDPSPHIPPDHGDQKAILRERYSGSGWESPQILKVLGESDSLYFDRVSQIRMDRWHKGRVALLGDAAFCVSLLAGQGSALAMIAAYVLAGELKRANGDHEAAFAKYQERLFSFIARKQKAALGFADFFAPKSRFSLFVRNQGMRLFSLPFLAEFTMGRDLRDEVVLEDY